MPLLLAAPPTRAELHTASQGQLNGDAGARRENGKPLGETLEKGQRCNLPRAHTAVTRLFRVLVRAKGPRDP